MFFTLIILDGDFDLPQDQLAALTNGRAEGGDGGRGVEVEHIEEIFVGEVFLRLQPAAGQQGVGGADHGGVSEGRAHVEVIIIIQERPVNDTEDVILIVVPVFIHKLGGDAFKLFRKPMFSGNIEAALQGGGHGVIVFVLIGPKIRAAGLLPAAGIGYVEHILDFRIVAAGVDERDALAPAPDIAPHGLVPEIVVRAGRGLRALGVDHELLMVGVLVKPRRRGEKAGPRLQAAGELLGCLIGHLRIEL